ncbi:MAG: ABC transporter substrate-binding protein [Micromonosporaceae bacterium]
MVAAHDINRRDFLKIGGLGVAGAYLAGCSFGGDPAAAEQALQAAFAQPINDLDPHGPSSVDESTLIAGRLIYDTLTHRVGDKLEPSVATSWEQTDPKTWTFKLRDDVKFHDGSPLTARDVAASVERVRDAGGAQSPLWIGVKAEAPDDQTLRVTTEAPLGTVPQNFSILYIVPASKMNQKGFFDKPIGSGPFKVKSFTPADKLEVTAVDHWDGKPKLKSVTVPYIPETSSQITALRTRDVHILWPIPPDQVQELKGVDGVELETVPSYNYYFNWFNCGRKPFDDPRVRRAMWQAADVAGTVKNLFGNGAKVMTAPIPDTVFGHAAQQPYEYDPDAAKKALAEAGLKDGFSTTLMWFDDTGPLANEFAQALISDWSKVGIKVEPERLEKAEWLRRLTEKDFDMELQTNTVTTADADFTLGRLYDSAADRMNYQNPELDKILRAAHEDSDKGRREELYSQACKIIWEDAVGIFPAALISSYGRRTTVNGFDPAPNNQPDLRGVTITE